MNRKSGCGSFLIGIVALAFVVGYWYIAIPIVLLAGVGYFVYIKYQANKALHTVNFDSMTGVEFEKFCANLLRANGYSDVKTTKASGDHGVDILAYKDGYQYAIQCKCYSGNVGNSAVQEAYTGRDVCNANYAVVMTNRYFTPQAQAEAQKIGVILWDRDTITEMQLQSPQKETVNKENKGLSSHPYSQADNTDQYVEDVTYTEVPVIEPNQTYDFPTQPKVSPTNKNVEPTHEVIEPIQKLYPAGVYVVGDNIEPGTYQLLADPQKDGLVVTYNSHDDYRNKNILNVRRFKNDYSLFLKESGVCIDIENCFVAKKL